MTGQLTPEEVRALRGVLACVNRIVANNSQSWTAQYGLKLLAGVWTEDARSAAGKLSKAKGT